MNSKLPKYERQQVRIIRERLKESPTHIIMVTGPRQVGKSTIVQQALQYFPSITSYAATDWPAELEFPLDDIDPRVSNDFKAIDITQGINEPDGKWLIKKWRHARNRAKKEGKHILAIDEIQKIPQWSSVVKGLWDEERYNQVPLYVLLLGSSPWKIQEGLTESLMGRLEKIPVTHWSFSEMIAAFDFSYEEYIYFGGYPGCAQWIQQEERWRNYVKNSLIEPCIERDIMGIARIDKPALLKNLFEIGCIYSGQIISLNKLAGSLTDKGHLVTLAHYLNMLSEAGLLTGLQKYYPATAHLRRSSPPKLNVQNTALFSSLSDHSFESAKADKSHWGRLIESAIGSYLINQVNHKRDNMFIYYWRENGDEVDFIIQKNKQILALEVKSGLKIIPHHKGLNAFCLKYPNSKKILIGRDISPNEFLLEPLESFF